MTRRFAALAISTALVLTSLALPAPTAAQTVNSMAATGDSITRAFNLCFFPFTDCPAQSWSTGTNTTVNSHARRLGITSSAHNDAVSGAKMADLPGQMSTVVGRNVDYVTVLMGGNDVCTDTEDGMTPTSDYVIAFGQAMDILAADPDKSPPLVYVVSVPNVKMLWEILKDNSTARSRWSSYNICQSLLANPLSTDQADVDRRERVKQRNMELNQALRAACAAYAFCRFDGERVFGTPFIPNDVSTRDYFHPSTAGQKKLADVSWTHGPLVTSTVNAPPTAGFTVTECSGLTCTFTDTSSDPNGISGRSWNFDAGRAGGGTSVAQQVQHTFPEGGTYTVKLYAIDDHGATSSTSQAVTVSDSTEPTNNPPSASFTFSCTDLTCSFDGTGSRDSDGTITTYHWDFGDPNTETDTSTDPQPTYTYAADDTYTVTLTVTDNDGATGITSQSVTVTDSTEPTDAPPSASFTFSCTDLTCNFDGSGSSDDGGTISSYSWNFGDDNTGTGATVAHTYASGGTYTVTLTVTDDQGATDSEVQSIGVTAPSEGIKLTVTGSKVKGTKIADLAWSGATSTSVDVYRDGAIVATTANDGAYTDNTGQKGGGSHTYRVCEAGTNTCSDHVSVSY